MFLSKWNNRTRGQMIQLYRLCAKSNNLTPGQSECDVTCFCFCVDFVRSHVLYSCFVYVFKLRFSKILKVSTKNMNNYKYKTFRDILRKVRGKPDKINKLIRKTKADLKEKETKGLKRWAKLMVTNPKKSTSSTNLTSTLRATFVTTSITTSTASSTTATTANAMIIDNPTSNDSSVTGASFDIERSGIAPIQK